MLKLNNIEVTYLNPRRKNTFGNGVKPASYKLFHEGKEYPVYHAYIEEPYASLIRERKISKIIVNLL